MYATSTYSSTMYGAAGSGKRVVLLNGVIDALGTLEAITHVARRIIANDLLANSDFGTTISADRRISGATDFQSGVEGILTRYAGVQGQLNASSDLAATIRRICEIAGVSGNVSDFEAYVTVTDSPRGFIEALSNLTGVISVIRRLQGTVAPASEFAGMVKRDARIISVIDGYGDFEAISSMISRISSRIDGLSTINSILKANRGISGEFYNVSGVDATIRRLIDLYGESNAIGEYLGLISRIAKMEVDVIGVTDLDANLRTNKKLKTNIATVSDVYGFIRRNPSFDMIAAHFREA